MPYFKRGACIVSQWVLSQSLTKLGPINGTKLVSSAYIALFHFAKLKPLCQPMCFRADPLKAHACCIKLGKKSPERWHFLSMPRLIDYAMPTLKGLNEN